MSTKSVSFSTVSIRSYGITIGDSPSVSCGIPISLDWNFVEEPRVMLDDFEKQNLFRRHRSDLILSPAQRRSKLANNGISGRQQQASQKCLYRPVLCRRPRRSAMGYYNKNNDKNKENSNANTNLTKKMNGTSTSLGNITIASAAVASLNECTRADLDIYVPSPKKKNRRSCRPHRRNSMVPIPGSIASTMLPAAHSNDASLWNL